MLNYVFLILNLFLVIFLLIICLLFFGLVGVDGEFFILSFVSIMFCCKLLGRLIDVDLFWLFFFLCVLDGLLEFDFLLIVFYYVFILFEGMKVYR